MAERSWDLESGPRIAPPAEHGLADRDIVDFWLREEAMPLPVAEQRVSQVHLVAAEEDGAIAGVSSAYLERSEQLRMPMWHYRAFVGEAYRRTAVAVRLAVTGRQVLSERFVSGADQRAPGIIYEVENADLRRMFPEARWLPTDFWFIGENAYGDHVRVHWFPGALAPGPYGRT